MLKVTFTETGLHVEQLTQSPQEWIGLRVLLAMRVSQRLVVEPGTATILLRADLADLPVLERCVRQEMEGTIGLCRCDADYIEVSLSGTWVTSSTTETEGVFIAILPEAIELLVLHLWQVSQACPSSLWR
jgi:hypothetical protein